MTYVNWILGRLNEASTWAGFAAACAAVGVAISSHQPLYIAILSGVIAIVKRG